MSLDEELMEPMPQGVWQEQWARVLATHDLLDAQEEKMLLQEVHSGDPEKAARARQKLMESNSRMLIKVARAYQRKGYEVGLELGDLVSEGLLGLNRAIEKFDVNRPVKFITYAWPWVKLYISRAVIEKSTLVRVPCTAQQQLMRAKKDLDICIAKVAVLSEDSKDSPEYRQALMEKKEVEARYYEASKLIVPAIDGKSYASLSDPEGIKTDEPSFMDDRDESILEGQREKILKDSLEQLPTVHRNIIEARFGLGNKDVKAIADLARIHKITAKKVAEIEAQAMDMLKDYLKEQGVSPDQLF